MKKSGKLFLILSFLSLGVFGLTANFSGVPTASAAVSVADSPRQVYVNNCARCHGADGKGETELGQLNEVPDLTARRRSVKSNISLIKKGRGSMPGFAKKLSAKDIASLAAYVRGL